MRQAVVHTAHASLRWRRRGPRQNAGVGGGPAWGASATTASGRLRGSGAVLIYTIPEKTLQPTSRVSAAAAPSADGGNEEAKNGNTGWRAALLLQLVTAQPGIPHQEVGLSRSTGTPSVSDLTGTWPAGLQQGQGGQSSGA